jgi:hypothetical protein
MRKRQGGVASREGLLRSLTPSEHRLFIIRSRHLPAPGRGSKFNFVNFLNCAPETLFLASRPVLGEL